MSYFIVCLIYYDRTIIAFDEKKFFSMIDFVTMNLYFHQFQNDIEVIRMAYKNSRMLERIGQANLSDDQLNTIFPVTEKTADCNAVDGLLCVGELSGKKIDKNTPNNKKNTVSFYFCSL